jgi:uncharacterized caspase-like protein
LNDIDKLEQIKLRIAAEIARLGLSDFAADCGGGDTVLISRAGHVHATWHAAAGRLSYTQAGYGAPSFTTLDLDVAVRHTMRMLAQTKST